MKHFIIFLITLDAQSSQQLNYFRNYTLQSLLQQTSQDYVCFVTYGSQWEEEIEKLKKEIHDIGKFHFLPRRGKPDFDGIWANRILDEEMKKYLSQIVLHRKDDLIFMQLETKWILSKNLVQKLKSFKAHHYEKVLLLKSMGETNQKAFAFRCEIVEYDRYFRHYERLMGLKYEKFDEFPSTVLEQVYYQEME